MRFVMLADDNFKKQATMCVESIRRHHPKCTVVQLTDEKSEQLPGVDEAWRCRSNNPEMPWYVLAFMGALAEMDAAPTAVIGSDTLVCKPMDDVWEQDFDIALTWRPEIPEMRYNLGISFCSNAEFFKAVYERMNNDPKLQRWMGDQYAVMEEVATGKWNVLELPCTEWNNFYFTGGVAIPEARMLHYKGTRKRLMEHHYETGVWK